MLSILRSEKRPSRIGDACHELVECIVREIENLRIYPRLTSYRDLVLLALFDKIVTTSRAVLSLVRAGFADEAYGLSRTAIEAFFSLKYIENKDSEARAKRYLEYFGKDREHLMSLIAKHHPHLADARSPDYDQLMKMAKQFKSPHKWFPENSLKEVAYEKSTWAVDEFGDPQQWEYTYDIVYKLASHEVHATSVALEMRVADFLENSRYPAAFTFKGPTSEGDGDNAAFNGALHSYAAVEHVFHAFDMTVPETIRIQFQKWQKVVGVDATSHQPASSSSP
jgi:hypothetical protein